MPRSLQDYTLREHLRLQPLLHALKTRRYRRIDEAYFRLPATGGDIREVQGAIAGKRLFATIAFNDPDALDLHAQLVGRLANGDVHLIADNSTDDGNAAQNAAIAVSRNCLYLRLPPNPWNQRNASRSHGIALNWLWHCVMRPAAPQAFAFLDADIFPTRPCDPFKALDDHPFAGDKRWAGERWFLWAGYCFFRFDAVAHLPLDFGLDWFLGLDTGGANWQALYLGTDPRSLPERPLIEVAALDGIPLRQAYFEWRGDWLHEVGLAGDASLRRRKRQALRDILQPVLVAPATEFTGP